MNRIFILTAVFLLTVFFLGCEGPEGTQGPQGEAGIYPISVNAEVEYSEFEADTTAYVKVYISQIPEVPLVSVNGIALPFNGYYYSDLQFRYSDFPILRGDSAHLIIDYIDIMGDSASAWADVIVPGHFQITQPDTDEYQHPFFEDLTVTWTPSEGAEVYRVHLSMNIMYHDSAGDYQQFYFYEDSVFTGSETITYPADMIFPQLGTGDVFQYGTGSVWVYAEDGPAFSTVPYNIQGDGYGFFNAQTKTQYINLQILYEE